MAANKIVDLRNLLAERFASAGTSPNGALITGIDVLDQTGGLHKGAITELTSPQLSAGSALLIHCLLKIAQRDRFFLALVDGRDSFDVQSASPSALAHLLWVRCETTAEAMKAADFLLRDGNFPLVILDLILNAAEELRRIPSTSWYRLQRLVEASPTAFLVMSRHNLVPSARTKLVLENRWQLRHLQNEAALDRVRLRLRRSHGVIPSEAERSGEVTFKFCHGIPRLRSG
jgi:recA bacterial DNA recombination protein